MSAVIAATECMNMQKVHLPMSLHMLSASNCGPTIMPAINKANPRSVFCFTELAKEATYLRHACP